jgi:hypothetical protein
MRTKSKWKRRHSRKMLKARTARDESGRLQRWSSWEDETSMNTPVPTVPQPTEKEEGDH